MSPTKARIAVVGCLALVVAAPSLARSGAISRETRIVLLPSGVDSQRKATNVECALRAPVKAVLNRIHGFAVGLSEPELNRLRTDPEILLVRPDPGSWVASIDSRDPAFVEARTRELERQLGFTSDQRYNTATYRGFGAVLDWRQLNRLSGEVDVSVNPDPWVYIVFYVDGVDVDARTDELERRYGFTSRHRYRALGGFSAELTKVQLGGIATEADIQGISPDRHYASEASSADCLRSFPRLRKQLRAAFVRAHPRLAKKRLRGPFNVRFASNAEGESVDDYALARFTHPRLAVESQPEAFTLTRVTGFRWLDLDSTGGTLCTDPDGEGIVPRNVLHAWLLPPAGTTNCYRTN